MARTTDKRESKRIEDLPGIGTQIVEKLKKLGYTTVETLATASLKELTDALDEKTASAIITEARKQLISVPFMRADEYMKIRNTIEQLTTGSKQFDLMLGGGIETQSMTEVYGEFGSGKSQLCHQLCVNVQLPKERGGLDGSALYIDTENSFRPERIVQMARKLGLDHNEVLKRIVYAEALTTDHQLYLVDTADTQFKEHNIRLIIIDSLIAHFRSEYVGREMLAERQQVLEKHLHRLMRFARAFNAVAFVTNQVVARPDSLFQDIGPTGGHILAHTSHTRLFLRKSSGSRVKIARLIVSPNLPEGGECPFRISEDGVEDASS